MYLTSDHSLKVREGSPIKVLLDLTKEVNILLFLRSGEVESNLVKLETSRTVILPLQRVSVLWFNRSKDLSSGKIYKTFLYLMLAKNYNLCGKS